MADYRIKIRITSHSSSDLDEEKIVSGVGATYKHVLEQLDIPYDFIEVEVEKIVPPTPKLEIVKQNGHRKTE